MWLAYEHLVAHATIYPVAHRYCLLLLRSHDTDRGRAFTCLECQGFYISIEIITNFEQDVLLYASTARDQRDDLDIRPGRGRE